MLNHVIRIDLHIHSKASAYKESNDCVKHSDVKHIDDLLSKLTSPENSIDLFSVTDHNRFDADLYAALFDRIKERNMDIKLLAGVEFDVELQEGKPFAHIITIFNAKTPDDRRRIQDVIEQDGLIIRKDAFYEADKFESLLKHIGLDAVLIVHQHSGFGGNQHKRSAGKASDEAVQLYKYGYFDALEYNNRHIQGVLRGELADLNLPARVVIGSDCHEWNCYPRHDRDSAMPSAYFAEIRALPTFRGLVMALTSPNTRIGFREPVWKDSYCKRIDLCGKNVPLSPGLNVIIGENGSGKSSLLSLLCDDASSKKNYVRRIANEYRFRCEHKPVSPVYVHQGELQDKYGNDTVFDSSLFRVPDNTIFSNSVRSFAESLKQRILFHIGIDTLISQARQKTFLQDSDLEEDTFQFTVSYSDDFANEGNPWTEHVIALTNIISLLDGELSSNAYTPSEATDLENASKLINGVLESIRIKEHAKTQETKVKGIILNAFKRYDLDIEQRSEDVDRKRSEYRKDRAAFIGTIVALARNASTAEPEVKSSKVQNGLGITRVQKNGLSFARSARYSESDDFAEDFFACFNTHYQSLREIDKIRSRDEMEKALPRCKPGAWETSFDALVEKFIQSMCETHDTILDIDNNASGNTLGEKALTYYKYMSYDTSSMGVFIADQPEDNISNQRISTELVEYLDDLRRRVQVIIVTHNPLLVVNIDADNVIALRRTESNDPDVIAGCLESEDGYGSVLGEVAAVLDGGKDAIKRRLAAYDTLNRD